MVEKVEELRAKLQRDVLADRRSFAEGDIPVVDAGSANHVATEATERPQSRKGERAAEPAKLRLFPIDRAAKVGALPDSAHSSPVAGNRDRERRTRFETANAGELPTSQDMLQEATRSAEERQFVNIAQHQYVCAVKTRKCTFHPVIGVAVERRRNVVNGAGERI